MVRDGNRLSSAEQVQNNVIVAGTIVVNMALNDVSRGIHVYILLLCQSQ